MAVATQEVFAHTDALVETWSLGAATPANTLVKQAGSDRYGVSLTNTVGVTPADSITIGETTISRPKRVGVGNDKADAIGEFAAGVATDGTWEFPVTGGLTTTPQGAVVYATAGGQPTLTATSNTRIGAVNYPATYVKAAGTLPVKIGA